MPEARASLAKKHAESEANAKDDTHAGRHLLWIGGLANGYPAVKRGDSTFYAKRVLWAEIHGSVPEGAVLVSTCGERTYIEPAHLGLSTPGRYASVGEALGRYVADLVSAEPLLDVELTEFPAATTASPSTPPGSRPGFAKSIRRQ